MIKGETVILFNTIEKGKDPFGGSIIEEQELERMFLWEIHQQKQWLEN